MLERIDRSCMFTGAATDRCLRLVGERKPQVTCAQKLVKIKCIRCQPGTSARRDGGRFNECYFHIVHHGIIKSWKVKSMEGEIDAWPDEQAWLSNWNKMNKCEYTFCVPPNVSK